MHRFAWFPVLHFYLVLTGEFSNEIQPSFLLPSLAPLLHAVLPYLPLCNATPVLRRLSCVRLVLHHLHNVYHSSIVFCYTDRRNAVNLPGA